MIRPSPKGKFLGILFPPNLSWGVHVDNLWHKCQCPLKILSCLTHTWWGADPRLLKIIYNALVRARLDYGCFILNGLSKNQRIKLDRIQYKTLRFLGLRKSTPTNFILAEAKEPPLFLRSKFLCSNFISRVYSQIDHPIIPTFNNLQNLVENPTQVDYVGSSLILDSYMEISHLSLFIESKSRPLCYNFPYSSLIFSPETNLEDGVKFDKSVNGQRPFCDIFEERATSYCLFTHGSRKDESDYFGFSVVSEDGSLVRKFRSLGFVSIFTLKAMAILCAVKEIERVEGERFSIFSDSKSVIIAFANAKINGRTSFLILEIKHCSANLLKMGKRIKFIWIPSHCGIVGNERADMAAKEAICSGTDSPFNVSSRDLRIKWSNNLFSAFFDWCKNSSINRASWYMDNCLTSSRRT